MCSISHLCEVDSCSTVPPSAKLVVKRHRDTDRSLWEWLLLGVFNSLMSSLFHASHLSGLRWADSLSAQWELQQMRGKAISGSLFCYLSSFITLSFGSLTFSSELLVCGPKYPAQKKYTCTLLSKWFSQLTLDFGCPLMDWHLVQGGTKTDPCNTQRVTRWMDLGWVELVLKSN